MGGIHHTLVDILVAVKIVSVMKLVQEKGDHTVTFTLTVALAFPSGMRCEKVCSLRFFNLAVSCFIRYLLLFIIFITKGKCLPCFHLLAELYCYGSVSSIFFCIEMSKTDNLSCSC